MRSGSEVEKAQRQDERDTANEKGIWRREVIGSFTEKIEEKKCPSSEEREGERRKEEDH